MELCDRSSIMWCSRVMEAWARGPFADQAFDSGRFVHLWCFSIELWCFFSTFEVMLVALFTQIGLCLWDCPCGLLTRIESGLSLPLRVWSWFVNATQAMFVGGSVGENEKGLRVSGFWQLIFLALDFRIPIDVLFFPIDCSCAISTGYNWVEVLLCLEISLFGWPQTVVHRVYDNVNMSVNMF